MESTALTSYIADLDAAAIYGGSPNTSSLRPVRCVGTAGSSLRWVNGFCVSYTERKIYHAWTVNYFHNGEEARGGARTNAVMFFVYHGNFLDQRLCEPPVPDAVAVAGLGYFRVNRAWVRTIDDPFSFQGIRDDGAAIVVVSFLSVLKHNGAKMLLGLQAPNPCFDVLQHVDYGYTNLVTSEFIWLGPQLATNIAQFVVVLLALGSVKSDISVSILVDLVSATTYSLVLFVFSLLGKYYLVFNLSSILTSDSLVSICLISVVSFYHNLIVSHVWPSKLFAALTPSLIRTGVIHRGFLTLLALAVTVTEVCLGCTYNESLQVGTNPAPCIFGVGDCFNAINLPVVGCVVGYLCLLTVYTLGITTYIRSQPHGHFVAAKLMSFRQVQLATLDQAPATTFETFCCGKRLDQLLQARYLCVDVQSGQIGTHILAVMTLGFVPTRSGLLLRFNDYLTLAIARFLPGRWKRRLRILIPIATISRGSISGPVTFMQVGDLPVDDLRISALQCIV
ncbi:hypothetical protein SPRG_01219 [Saprolegnia parasitica CBS 223.65]|uniref:Uncharacterized protein n=1 Tax=Saprolegnia parasitica (strain CBS 223.65) TaxID=695850 RepID=A0A067D825_SAPPC|nr:hypothetical protein SPRG_01219 [Saprolegnia parasitica CBS 223.65]KDO35152.1 hypothetical protein SPRG_01219 [Saprolegnia parasitica CBS 223.65]|eukprot:XP_012194799.1 hypothetical protein SPRG_01219 [Saprolegnia parasitica CBS 223.65]